MDNDIGVFMVDPPWPKKKGGKRKVRPAQGRSLDYEVMRVPDIFTLLDAEVFPLAETRHTVFMWVIDEFLHHAEAAMAGRGYRLHARLVWDKQNGVAPAFSIRYCHEYLMWFYKPKFTPVANEARGKFSTIMRERARQHSRKPDFAYSMLESMFPQASKLDVFSRESRDGWRQFGDQPTHFMSSLGERP